MAAVTYNPSSISVGEHGQSVTVSWTGGNGYYSSATPNVGWIHVSSNTNTPTAGNIEIYIDQNNSTSSRSGTLQICLGSCTNISVTQAAHFVFTVTVTPSEINPPAAGGTGTLTTTNAGTSYSVDIYDDWIHITSPTTPRGNATISYSIDANATGSDRYTEFYVDDQTVTVTNWR